MKAVRRIGRLPDLRAVMLAALASVCLSAPVSAQQNGSRFLAKEDIFLYGVGLKVEPASQTVPRDIATIVSTFLQAPNDPEESLPPFAPNAVVRATLRGPSFAAPVELTAAPNSPFNIPPLTVAGLHTLDEIRMVSNGEVILRGAPESASINVINELLVTQVTARPLSAAEIREQGIVFDKNNFQAYNFTAAFAVKGVTVDLNFPVLLPRLAGAQDVAVDRAHIPSISAPALQNLRTIIPDTLKIQTQVPNLSVVGFSLKVAGLEGEDLIVPAIPGVIVFPGNIGFLNQFFSVLLMVSNVAPEGSSLVVSDLRASIVLPPGRDNVVNTPDDPLAMARTAAGETPRLKAVTQPGADGQLGTADDVLTLGPGQTGNAEYLVEGRREGSQVVEMELEGTLHGLPVGPVTIRGRAAGAVLVKNPTYTLTFIHPETVSAGEPYTLDITVTNTSESPANFVSVNLLSRNISGATLVGEPTREIESIPPGDSATVTFDLISRVTGNVTAATLDSDEQIAGRFELKHAVGELGVPLSPESLVLPKEASALPKSLRDATLGLLGKAWAVATSPAAALPRDIRRFSRQMVLDMAVATAEAGLRVTLTEPLRDSSAQLALDMFGSLFTRLPARNLHPADLEFAQNNYLGFDDLRRKSIRGEVFAQAVADLLQPDLASLGVTAFHRDLAQKTSYRPPQISVLAGSGGNPLPVNVVIVDEEGRRLGGVNAQGRVVKEIPFADLLLFKNAGAVNAQMAFLVAPPPGDYTIRLEPVSGAAADAPFSLSIVTSRADGSLRHVTFENITLAALPEIPAAADDIFHLSGVGDEDAAPVTPTSDTVVDDPEPWILNVIQRAEADRICDAGSGPMAGRIVAVLFSEEVTPESVQDTFKPEDITNYSPEANRVVSVALQPGRRIAYLALRDSYGPFFPRQISIAGVADARGQVMQPQTLGMVSTIPPDGGVVSGRVLNADGSPIPFANVRLFNACPPSAWVGISSKNADEQGRYAWDYVVEPYGKKIVAVDPETEEFREVQFVVQRKGQRINVDIVMLGRGTFSGRTLSEAGTPLRNTNLRITSQTDQSQYGAITDANGAFTVTRIPVGNILVEAVNTTQKARTFLSENIPFAGATTTRDIVLLNVETTQTTVKRGHVKGHVLRADNATPVADVPVILYYESNSQPGVVCAPDCPIALVNTDAAGAFSFQDVTAGRLRIETFEQASFQKGQVAFTLGENATVEANVILAAGLGIVRGIVVGADGQPIAGARVGGGLSLTTTNQNGEFTLTDVPVGRTDIVAVSDTLGTRGVATIDITRAGEEVNARIELEGRGGVAGIVRSSTGQPVANIKVYLYFPLGGGSISVVGTAITDAQGGYSISNVPLNDSYTVSAFTSDFSDGNIANTAVKFNGQVARRDVKFRGGRGTVRGRLLDDDGVTPLRGRVGVSGDQVQIAGGQVGVGFQHVANFEVVDSNFTTGAFSMSGLFVGPFTLSAVGQFSPDPVSLENAIPSAGATVDMDIQLQSTSQVTGRVFRPDGVTPVGANLIVTYKSEAFRSICSEDASGEPSCESIPQGIQEEIVVTDADGRFGVPLVNAGPFTVTVEEPATGLMGRAKGSVKPGEVIDLSMRLIGRGQITIKVRGSDTTTPVSGARVELKQLDFPNRSFDARADSQGVLVVGGGDAFTEGAYVVIATDLDNGFAGRASGVIAHDGEQVTTTVFLYNQRGVVYGSVFKSDGITPVPNAEVVVSNTLGPLALTVTDAAGTYRVEQVPLGAVTVDVFEASTARRGFATGQIFSDGQEVPINITEAALGVVRGTVLEAGSLSPLKAWRVRLIQTAPNGRTLSPLAAMSSVDGTFSFPGVSKGTVALNASHDMVSGSGTGHAVITREGQVVDVPLLASIVRPRFGAIQGVVRTPTGALAANMVVTVCLAGCEHPSSPRAVTGSDGEFLIENIPLGRHEVRAVAQGSADAGTAFADVAFDGQVVGILIPMIGLTAVTGQVVNGDGSPAAFAQVTLEAIPATGCFDNCIKFADGNGNFSFSNLPARRVTVRASAGGLKGVVGEVVNPGEVRNVRIVLEPTGSLRGRALRQSLSPAAGVIADLLINNRHVFTQTGSDGTFEFPTTPVGVYTLTLEDAITDGIATRGGTLIGSVELGDVRLDEASPSVASTTPASAAMGVPLSASVRVVFTETVNAGTINSLNVSLSDDEGVIPATLSLGTNDTAVTMTPLAPLSEFTRYSIRVQGVKDVVGKPMETAYVASFTTVDLTPPTHLNVSPAAATNGVPVTTTIRVTFSEPIDPTRLTGPFFAVSGPTGAVAGRIDYAFANTVAIFTPIFPLAENAVYRVQASVATDIAGNVQAQGLDYTFATTDRTPPQILQLNAPASVIEHSIASVVADVGIAHDVGFVDFFVNDVFVAVARSTPFTLRFQAIPALGAVGDLIIVSAVATDTSGNRGQPSAPASLLITPDQPPVVTITTPPSGFTARNGDRIVVNVRAVDDLGVTQQGYKAQTGRPQDAALNTISPASVDRTETFAFHIPETAAPGSTILVEASASDTKGQIGQAAPTAVTVLDSVAPVVAITGASTGNGVRPGQQTTVIVSAQDLGGVTDISFSTIGLTSTSDARTLSPPQTNALASFTFQVPASAQPGDSITLRATAKDRAGNTGTAANVILPVVDTVAPAAQLRTSTGSLTMAPGGTVNVIVDASDGIGVSRVELAGSGAFSFSDAKQVNPPVGEAHIPFTIVVPATLQPGDVLNLQARAIDLANNVSAPAFLSLVTRAFAEVVLPSSTIVNAGRFVDVSVQLTGGAPAGGQLVTFTTGNQNVATASASVLFAAGETARTVRVTGKSGGTTQLSAFVQGVVRATMTITVQGGVVEGFVFDSTLSPAPGVQVTVTGSGLPVSAVTDGQGRYLVTGITGDQVTVRALDEATQHRGATTAFMSQANGFAQVDVVLIPAGSIRGTVRLADAETAAGAGVRVDLFASNNFSIPFATTFTDEAGEYEFDVVPLGAYRVDATASNGNRGRSNANLNASGDEATVDVVYLGRGSVFGIVRDGGGQPAGNAVLTFTNSSFLGSSTITRNALPDGSFRFDDVFVGTFHLSARDQETGRAAFLSGTLSFDGETLERNLTLATFGSIEGTVFRFDGVTPVAGANVSISGVASTTTDTSGHYEFAILPLGTYTVLARESSTRGIGSVAATLSANGQNLTRNISFVGQGTVVGIVTDANGVPQQGALFRVDAAGSGFSEVVSGLTDAEGRVIIPHVLAGTLTFAASKGPLSGSAPPRTLAVGQVLEVTVQLQPTASIAGTVLAPDGQTPQTTGTVSVGLWNPSTLAFSAQKTVPIASDGSFRFDGLTLGGYHLAAFDTGNRLRALIKTTIALGANGEVATRQLTFVGLGTVSGRVVNPNGTSAPNFFVQVRSLAPDFGRLVSATSNAGGFYQANNVVVGAIMATTGNISQGLLGESFGTLAEHGDTLTLDVLLQSNAVTLPVSMSDGNAFRFDIQANGSLVRPGTVFAGGLNATGGSRLAIVHEGNVLPFTGGSIGTREDSSREITTKQVDLGGLNIARKIFVPAHGYFARYLELLSNPTSEPITVDVRVASHLRPGQTNLVRATSSGDDELDVSDPATADRWVVVDDVDQDPFIVFTNNNATLAFTFDGSGAAERASAAARTTTSVCQPGCNFTDLVTYEWSSVTVPPGGTVAFMHFVTQQTSRAAAIASAERLVELPPEALSGLNADEIAAVRNFAIPTGGQSSVPPLPSLSGSITGRLLEWDATTLSPGGTVTFRSDHPIFARSYQRSVSSGQLSLTASLTGEGNHLAVPVDAFTLSARHSSTQVQSPVVNGTFPADELATVTDIVFSNTGMLTGRLLRATGQPVASTQVRIFDGAALNTGVTTASDGTFTFRGVPPGPKTLTASLFNSQGTAMVTNKSVTTSIGATGEFDLTFPATGGVTGIVRHGGGAPAVSLQVRIQQPAPAFQRLATTDSSGRYTFLDLPVGDYSLLVTEPTTQVQTATPATIVANTTITQDLTLNGIGTVAGTVTLASGAAASGSLVHLYVSTTGVVQATQTTNTSGGFSFANRAVGQSYRVRAFHPVQTTQFKETTNQLLATHGQTLTHNVTLPAQAIVRVTVRRPDSTALAGARVQIRDAFDSAFREVGNTNSSGVLLISNVPEGAYTIQVLENTGAVIASAAGSVTFANNGQTLDVVITTGLSLPRDLLDSNNSRFDIQSNGTLFDGQSDAFNTGLTLGLSTPAGDTATFTGASFAGSEENGRELVITQTNVLGLDVQRKIYVPQDGYFARYLEVLRNPGATAIEVSVNLLSTLGSGATTRILTTSSGDQTFAVGDRWVVSDDDAVATVSGDPTLAFVLDGADASHALATASLASSGSAAMSAGWSGIVIAPGQTVTLMHFVVQQPQMNDAGATAAAARLVQLPPEAIAGLTADERAAIVNWAVPANGSSPLAAIPPRTGQLFGQTFAGDGVTPLGAALVTYTNLNYPYLNASLRSVTSLTNGTFSFAGVFLEPFTLQGRTAVTQVLSPLVNGTFAIGQTSVTQHVVFSNTGIVRGRVLRGPMTLSSYGIGLDSFGSFVAFSNSLGEYVVTGLLPGTRVLTATNNVISGSVAVDVVAGQVHDNVDIIVAAGNISGRVTRANGASPGVSVVTLLNENGTTYASTTSTALGFYSFFNLPLNRGFLVRSQFPNVAVSVTTTATPAVITTDEETVTVNLTLRPFAPVRVTVVQPDDVTPIVNAAISLSREGAAFQSAGSTDAFGVRVLGNIASSFTVRANDLTGTIGETSGLITAAEDGNFIIDVRIMSTTVSGEVKGTFYAVDGLTPLPELGGNSVYVELFGSSENLLDASLGDTSYSVTASMPAGTQWTVRAHPPHPLDYDDVTEVAFGQFTRRGEVVTQDLSLNVGVVSGTVQFPWGGLVNFPNAVLTRALPFFTETLFATRVDGEGRFGIVVREAGDYVLTVQDPNSGLSTTLPVSVVDATQVTDVGLISLPETMSVGGQVTDHTGQVVANATVGLTSSVGADLVYTTATDENGSFFFEAPLGAPYRVQACAGAGDQARCGSRTTTFSDASVVLSGPGRVEGRVLAFDGMTLVEGAEVAVYLLDSEGPLKPLGRRDQVSPAGTFTFHDVPSGPVVVTARDPQTGEFGIANAELFPDSTAFMNVYPSTAVSFQDGPIHQDGGGFIVDVQCTGQIGGGGSNAGPGSVRNGQTLSIGTGNFGGSEFPCRPYSRGGFYRSLTLEGSRGDRSGLRVSREIYTPFDGEFTRYLEVLENPLPVDVTVRVRIAGSVTTFNPFVTTQSDTGAFIMDSSGVAAGVGFVYKGSSNESLPASFTLNGPRYAYEWVVTIPAGETRRLLHYFVQAPAGVLSSNMVFALVDPASVPGALDFLTEQELASIVNFVIQP